MTPSDLERRARQLRNGQVHRAGTDDLRAWRLGLRRRRALRQRLLTGALLAAAAAIAGALLWHGGRVG